jgi:dihydroflavonol-4-reductase
VTGASGFIGSHVSAALTDSGADVRAFCRSEPPARARVAEWCAGDLTDPAAVARAVAGCSAVVHTAALYSYRRSDAPRMESVNVAGTRHVLEACARAGVRRVVVTSSSATCGPVAGRAATERDAPPGWELQVPYKRTKLRAERLALAAADGRTQVVCVNPTTVVGEGDRQPTPSGRMVANVVAGRVRGYLPRGGINVVSVDDVAAGHVLALERGRPGERYILGGEDLSLREVFETVLGACGRPALLFPIPWPAVYGFAIAAEAVGRLAGREPRLIVPDEVRLSRTPLYFSSAKARAELGYAPRPGTVALAEAARWFDRIRPAPARTGPRLAPAS